MARAGYLGSNIANNMQIPHGVRVMFKRDAAGSNWIDLGDVSDLSVAPLAEFLEHFSNQDGKNALSKRILTNRGITIDATLNEVNSENLQLAFLGGAAISYNQTLNVPVAEVISSVDDGGVATWYLTDPLAGGSSGGTAAVPGNLYAVRKVDGDTFVVGSVEQTEYVDYEIVYDAVTDRWSIIEDLAVATDNDMENVTGDLHITYLAEVSTAATTFTVLDDTSVSGQLQFQIRNMEGGLAQVLELDSVTIAPSGALTVPVDAVQQVPLTITAQVVNGSFGRMHLVNI